jgi:anthranilate phosphoribosyltransferase
MNDKDQLSSSAQNLKLGLNLSEEELSSCIEEITEESVSLQKKKDFLKALAQKGETYEEFAIFIREFLKMSIDPELQEFAPNAIDLCGTGGDKAHSFNISTFVSFIVASAGVPVIKHGNRSISSKCGSADLIEAIGIPLNPPLELIRESMKSLNYTFLFAPHFHPAFKHIAPVRKALAEEGIVTIFNLLGPTINPAKPANQLLGVFDPNYLTKIGKALTSNNLKSGLVVHGEVNNSNIGGVDELTACGENQVFGIGKLAMEQSERWKPERWKVESGDFSDLSGGDLAKNIQIMKTLLKGNAPDSLRNTVLLNASTALWIQGKCSSLEEGIELADSLLIDGTVEQWLQKVSDFFK